jgi:hypothetical protein
LVVTKFLATIQDISGVETEPGVRLEEFLWNYASTTWLICFLLFVVGIVTIL